MTLQPGARLGPYEVLSALGAGGMGEVYKARDTRLDRTVAVKVLPADVAADPERRTRFEREARAIAGLSHPHIYTIHDVGRHAAIDYLVMEYLDGETLADRLLHAKGPLPLEQVMTISIAIADALDKAHRAGIVHRDIKPANVILTKAGPKLLDFGLAKLRGPVVPISLSAMTRATPMTADGTILGTIHYMAPEQIEGRDADTRSDIWALGAVIYEMATGLRPFDGESVASVIGAILKDTVPAVSTRQPLAPSALDHLVERCLEKDADERWQDARDVKRELTWIASARARAGAEVSLAQPARRALAPWIVVACVVVAAALGAAALLRPRPSSSVPSRMMFSIVPPDEVRLSGSFALSPDGRHFVFVGLGADGPPSLWVRSIDAAATQRLSGTEDASYPFWSPQSDAIGFFAGGKLKTVAVTGGVPKTLGFAPSGRGGTRSANGTILYAFVGSPLYRVADKGGVSTVATSLVTLNQVGHRWPLFLDGRHFVYTAQGIGDGTGIYLGSLTSDAATELYPVWSPDGSALLFSSNRGGFYNLYQKPVTRPGEETLLFKSASHQYSTDWSRDGRTIFFTNIDSKTQADIWMAPATGDGKAAPVLVTSFNEYAARLSPDGRWMAYTSDESGRPEVYVPRFPAGTGRVQISTLGGSEPCWRGDGRELFYLAANRTLTAVTVTTTTDFSAGLPTKLFDTIVDTNVGSIHGSHYMPTADGQRFLINVSAVIKTPTTVVLNWQAALGARERR